MTQSKLPSFLLTTWLLGTIATKSRVSDFLQSLQEYEIVHPRVIPGGSERSRRSIFDQNNTNEDVEEPMFIEISNWTLRTIANNRVILSSNFTTDWVYANRTKSAGYDRKMDCNLRQGNLEDSASSFVVVTLCEEEMYAMILAERRLFLVQPLMDGQHVMYEPRQARWRSFRENPDVVSVNRENPEGGAIVNTVTSNLCNSVLQARFARHGCRAQLDL